ncbi:hypothetical protein PLESTB_000660600 [Pleodorina starrii]|uniref:CASP C-terminal domain-containing protein n=1 Tax=Pleodorina starrii TaxID=330485 RepID=A0A9W6BJ10_9CHLO|nr:hypothetical protein PLESTM_001319900 [Pleodorina starrii]GLC52718.1 hypothetical protein PLESTB_000660600 [Pleodorina starrii]GLC76939.1 hypothetical protein PLESTF_001858000 [Pleodorina starrii]
MNFLKTLDQALDFERLEKTVTERVQQAALSVVEEFPDRHRAAPTGALLSITPTVLVETREVSEIWQAYEMERRKDEWEAACAELKALSGKDESGAHAWQRRAQDAEHKLYLLCSSLLALPDPSPFLYLLSTLAARVQDLEDANRKLQAAADQAAKDDAEVTSLIEKHQRLLENTKELQEELGRRDARIAEMSAAAAEAAIARQEMSAQAAEMARLQRSLRSVKEEYEVTQHSLFELQSRLENLAGSRQQEAELATEELDRVTKRAAELELERQQLLSRLESAQQAAGAGAGGGEAGSVGASAAGGGGSGLAGGGGGGGGLLGGDYVLLERQLAVREEQVSALSSSLEAVQRGAADAASRHALEMATLRDQVATTKLALERLEREVARRPDPKEYQELRRRAEALQSLVDVQMQAEGWSGEQVEATLRDPSAQTITSVLQERSRKLSSEVNSLKRQVAERDKQIQELEVRIQDLESDLQRRAQLVAQLEEHLAAAAGAAAASAAGGGGAAAATGKPDGAAVGVVPLAADADSDSTTALLPQLSGSLGIISSGDLSAVAAALAGGDAGGAAAGQAGGVVDGGGGGGSLLDIVVSQRDRFRQRMVQLEEEKSQLSDELHKTRQQLQSSRNDNVALFEKIRYLERYNQRAAAAGRTTVVRVDAAGVAQPSPEELAAARGNRYQCGPFALEVGGGRSGGAPEAGGAGPGGGGGGSLGGAGGGPTRFGGGGGATGVRSRGARRGGGVQVLACFGGEGDDVESSGATTAESRAARAYEARVNPFAEFQQSEAELRVRNLQVHDRALLAGSRLVLGSRVARMFLAVYTIMLHFIILLLFFYATTPCPASAAAVAPLDAAALAAAVAATAGGAADAAGVGAAAAARR